jgi:glycosyltransferase involved in cell wall biosynthesis
MIKVKHVAYSDISGGAARAAYRVHRSLVDNGALLDISSTMRVLDKRTRDLSVYGGRPEKEFFLWPALRQRIIKRDYKSFKGKETSFSIARYPTGLGKELNKADTDIINLHFLGNNTISIEEIGALNKPIVWRLPDMWAFCGTEHYTSYSSITEDERYIIGYSKNNRSADERGIDLNRLTWERKLKAWKRPMHIVAPTNWMASCVIKSKLMNNWPVTVIPTALDLQRWKPMEKSAIRYALSLPQDKPLVLFGAMGGTADPRKGGDLLFSALSKLKTLINDTPLDQLEVVIFGQDKPDKNIQLDFPAHFMGHLNDDLTLSLLYASADVMIVPSRLDNLPGTAIESLACGTPVVAFNIGGVPDIVEHQKSGWLAAAFDTDDLARGIQWILEDKQRHQFLCHEARISAELKYNPQKIASMYADLYRNIISNYKS